MTDAPRIFQDAAPGYEAARRRLVPDYDRFYDEAVGALGFARRPVGAVLDLGAGTGLLARRVLEAHPDARVTLLDGAPAMLDQARAALGDRCDYVVGDLADPPPDGPWDAVVSALAIHHLADAGKRALFARVRETLAPGGVFVNAEQVAGPTAALDARYAEWHEARARAAGSDDEEWAGAERRMEADRCSSVEDQLAWLRAGGFPEADCLYKSHRFAVLVARA